MKLFLWILGGFLLGWTVEKSQLPTFFIRLIEISGSLFLFVSGFEIRLSFFRQKAQDLGALVLGAFFIPFISGFFLNLVWNGSLVESVFLGTAFSVSAIPVIIYLLKEQNLYGTALGNQVLGVALACDLLAWVTFAFLLPSGASHWLMTHLPVLLFFVGVIWPKKPVVVENLLKKASGLMFQPLFFIGVGLQIGSPSSFDFWPTLTIIVLAILSKTLGTYSFARWRRLDKPASLILSINLNARGAMEIIMASYALRVHLISLSLFTSLVTMALVTSLLALPVLKLMGVSKYQKPL